MSTSSSPLLIRLMRHRGGLPTFIEAVAHLLLARLIVTGLSSRRARRLLAPKRTRHLALSADPAVLARIRWAVQTAARYVPCRALCFEQGIAAQRMLLRRGFAADLVYGVAKTPDGAIEAHVWTRVGRDTVVGGLATNRFTPVAVFTSDARVVPYETAGCRVGTSVK